MRAVDAGPYMPLLVYVDEYKVAICLQDASNDTLLFI